MEKREYDAIIIGGGLAGLVTGTALSKRGKKVLLLEKGHMLGGYQVYFKRDDFTIEPCLHLTAETGEGSAISQILTQLDMGDDIQFSRLDPVSAFLFPDERIIIPQDSWSFVDSLKRKFPEEADGIAQRTPGTVVLVYVQQ